MAQLNVRRTFLSMEVPLQSDIDLFLNDIETFLNITKLNNENIQDNSITASTKIAPLSITASKFKNVAVTTAKILDANVTTAKIADEAVTTAKINDSAVTTAKIADGAITNSKLANLNSQSASITATGTSSYVQLASVSITTNGRPIYIRLLNNITGSEGYINFGAMYVTRDSTTLFTITDAAGDFFRDGPSGGLTDTGETLKVPGGFFYIDVVSSGTYNYKLYYKERVGIVSDINNLSFIVYEL
jgi:hypothetical protein